MRTFTNRVNRALAKVGLRHAHDMSRCPRVSRDRADTPRKRWRVQAGPVHRTRLDSLRALHGQDWLIARHEVQVEHNPFCSGSFGKIHRGTWLGSRVVIKRVDIDSNETRRAFVREAVIWKHLCHPHVVPLYGACLSFGQASEPGLLVCEEAENGSLRDFLFKENQAGRSVVWQTLRDAALGLHYLHQRGIVHGDLKCNNILVGKTGIAMLTDFGLSFMPDQELSHSTPHEAIGAYQWKAPELLGSNCTAPTFESDLYAFGMCIVEALRGGSPWGELPDAAMRFHLLRLKQDAAEGSIHITEEARIMPKPSCIESKHWTLVQQLCAFDPSKRMKLPDAIAILQEFAEEEAAPDFSLADSSETL